MNVLTVMSELATALGSVSGLSRTYAYPPPKVDPPCGIVFYPEVAYDGHYQRGSDRYDLDVVVISSRITERTRRANLGGWVAGTGSMSVKAALEGGTYTDSPIVHVSSALVEEVEIAGATYLAAAFTVVVEGAP